MRAAALRGPVAASPKGVSDGSIRAFMSTTGCWCKLLLITVEFKKEA